MLCKMADGDARCLLNYLEELFMFSKDIKINSQNLVKILQQKLHTYDKEGHGFREGKVKIEDLKKTEKFFAKHLKL